MLEIKLENGPDGEKMNTDIIYNMDCINGIHQMVDEGSIDLVIADPPYFKVIGEKWDYSWRTEEEYLAWSEKWIAEASRALRMGGSFYLFGYFRMLSRLLPVLEKHGFELRQQIVLNKGIQAVSGRATKNYRMFPNVTESILFLWKDSKPFVKDFLKRRQTELGYSAKQINEMLGVKSNGGGMWSIYTGNNVCKQLPTEQLWDKLQKILDFDIPYAKICQTFHVQMGLTDVWDDVDFYEEKDRIHPTQKPQKLLARLILASSDEHDIVLDPFMGGGSTALACMNNNRSFIGFETEQEYFEKSLERLRGQATLF